MVVWSKELTIFDGIQKGLFWNNISINNVVEREVEW